MAEVTIRKEMDDDRVGVRQVEEAAFGRTGEADLVDALRIKGAVTLSMVARIGEAVIGHVLFSPIRFSPTLTEVRAVGMGPVAVLPDYQNQGIGKHLIQASLAELNTQPIDIVFVLGDPAYYSRFGFKPAAQLGARCAYEVPADVFMGLEFSAGCLSGWQGTVYYDSEFDNV